MSTKSIPGYSSNLAKQIGKTTLIAASLISQGVKAEPTAWPKGNWDLKAVQNNTTSTIMADSTDPKTVWVLPPSAGTSSAGQLVGISANVGFCQEMADLQSYSLRLTQKIADLDLQQGNKSEELNQKQTILDQANQAAAQLAANNQAVSQISKFEASIESTGTQIDSLYSRLDDCGTNDALCNSINLQIQSKEKDKRATQSELTTLRRQYNAEYTKYLRAKAVAEAAKDSYDRTKKEFDDIQQRLVDSKDTLDQLYKHLGQMYGAQTEIVYNTRWDENIAQLRSQNAPDLNFAKPFTNHTRVYVSFAPHEGADDYLSQMPILLSYTLNGVPHSPNENQAQTEGTAVPSKLDAILNLNLTGACPLLYPEKYTLSKDRTGMPLLGVSATYDYPATFRTKIKFNYNLEKFYSVMHDKGSTGGFFSSHSWDTIRETQLNHDAFTADWQESDPDNVVPDTQKRDIERQIKDELIARVLQQFGTPVFNGTSVNAAAAPKNGANVLADGLNDVCGGSGYCKAGAWVLKGLSAIFGHSSSTSTYEQNFKSDATEEWSRDTVRYKPGIMVFTRK